MSKGAILAGVVAVVSAAWTGGWYYASGEAEARMDAELGKLQARGVAITCPRREIGGFPIRFEVRCTAPTVSIDRTGATARVAALRAVVLLYNPTHAIIELDGPLEANLPATGTLTATWSTLQASVRLVKGWSIRASLAIKTLDAKTTAPMGTTVRLLAETAEAHVRPLDIGAGRFDIDIHGLFQKLQTELDAAAVGPSWADVSLDLTAKAVPLTHADNGLKAWAAAGGMVEIGGVKMTAGDFDAHARGDLSADDKGLLTGAITLTAIGLETVAANPASLGLPKGAGAAMGALMIMAPRETVDGVERRRLDIRFERGAVRIGPIKAGSVPPLFQ